MQRISIALSALISRKQYRLQAASKVTKTERLITTGRGGEGGPACVLCVGEGVHWGLRKL